jgi:hypothetical protein
VARAPGSDGRAGPPGGGPPGALFGPQAGTGGLQQWILRGLIKQPERAIEKATVCYGEDVSRLLDVFRARALFAGADQARYDKIWRRLLEKPSAQMNLVALVVQVESIVSKRPGSVAQQLNRLCTDTTEHRSSLHYAQLQSALASFSLKRRYERR